MLFPRLMCFRCLTTTVINKTPNLFYGNIIKVQRKHWNYKSIDFRARNGTKSTDLQRFDMLEIDVVQYYTFTNLLFQYNTICYVLYLYYNGNICLMILIGVEWSLDCVMFCLDYYWNIMALCINNAAWKHNDCYNVSGI